MISIEDYAENCHRTFMACDIAWKSIKDLETLHSDHRDDIRIAVMNTRGKLRDELAKLPTSKLEDIWNAVRAKLEEPA